MLSHRAGRAFFRGGAANVPSAARSEAAQVGADNSLLRRLAAAEGGLSEVEYQQIVNESCEGIPTLCATRMAAWMVAHPESPARDKRLAELRPLPQITEHLSPDRLASLAVLLDPARGRPGSIKVEEATKFTNLFVEYFVHDAPFSREGLASIWRRCDEGSSGATRCTEGLARAEERLGALGRATHARSGAPPG